MKKIIIALFAFAIAFATTQATAQDMLSPFFSLGSQSGSLEEVKARVKGALESKNFEILGSYHPSANKNMMVIAYTRQDLKNTVIKVKDRGALASVLKIGLIRKDNKVTVSMLNPEYMFYAYIMDNMDKYGSQLVKISNEAKAAMKTIGKEFKAFGGELDKEKLKEYHYKMMMPYFTDPVELAEFESFESGLKIIRNNLKAKKGNTVKVYEVIYKQQQVAVFGVGLLDQEDGEASFLPTIGEDQIAAMPYEIILQGNTATMLHGRFRFALYWPELSMGTFMKIVSTPGDVEDFLEELTEN